MDMFDYLPHKPPLGVVYRQNTLLLLKLNQIKTFNR